MPLNRMLHMMAFVFNLAKLPNDLKYSSNVHVATEYICMCMKAALSLGAFVSQGPCHESAQTVADSSTNLWSWGCKPEG